MTKAQAMELSKGDIVIMDGDRDDWGIVVHTNGEVVKVDWEHYRGDPSLHRVDQMDKIQRGEMR
jgi:hypothetical protein